MVTFCTEIQPTATIVIANDNTVHGNSKKMHPAATISTGRIILCMVNLTTAALKVNLYALIYIIYFERNYNLYFSVLAMGIVAVGCIFNRRHGMEILLL